MTDTFEAQSSRPRLESIVGEFETKIQGAYGPRSLFPYHNSDHAHAVTATAETITTRLKELGITVDALVVRAAALAHDALYGVDPSALGGSSPEALAARYARELLTKMGAPDTFADQVEHAIAATEAGVRPISIEAKVLRAADLAGLAAPYATFRETTNALFEEHKARGGKGTFATFALQQLQFLGLYVADSIQLTPQACDECGRSLWHLATISNMSKLFREIYPEGRICLFVGDSSDRVFASQYNDAGTGRLLIEIVSKEALSKVAKRFTKAEAFSRSDVAMKVPGRANSIPVADRICDTVFIQDPEPAWVGELARVIADGGSFVIRTTHGALSPSLVQALERLGFKLDAYEKDSHGQIISWARQTK